MAWTEIFSARIAHIYLVYGLAFFVLGLAVALEIGRTEPTRFSQAMRPLAVFGLVHGVHEWIEMFSIVGRETYDFRPPTWFEGVRLVLLVVSFVSLVAFGLQMLRPSRRLRHSDLWIGLGMLLLYGLGVLLLGRWLAWRQPAWFAAADALSRYSLGIPGAALATWALLVQRKAFLRSHQSSFANDLLWAGLAFLLYGTVGQFFVGESPLFPSTILNAQAFQGWVGVPIQLLRAIMAALIAIFMIRALRSFEFNRKQALAAARRRVEEEISHRDALRREFLHRIVETQEEERTRIARELHDELGQVLTGLAIGLRGVQTLVGADNADSLREQLGQLEGIAVEALGNMRRLVNELRPALLDDMGLPAALRHHIENFANLTGIETELTICHDHSRLPGDVETILFRIVQEALTNMARHAQATHASIDLTCDGDCAALHIEDDGLGFDTAAVTEGDETIGWGLMGIQERVRLADGEIDIQSNAGRGTRLIITVPLKNTRGTDHAHHQADAG